MFQGRRTVHRSGGGGEVAFDFSVTPWIKRLLIANTAVFLILVLIGAARASWVVLHFGFSLSGLLTHPWSPLTYMFLHGGFWHLAMNMLGLFFFGPPLEREWGSRFFIKYYLLCGLGGALAGVLLSPWIDAGLMIGASGAIFGVLLAFALNWPNAPIYIWGIFPVLAKWFVTALGVMTLLAMMSGGGGNVAHWAHLGGLATGWVLLKFGDRISRTSQRLFFKERKAAVTVEKGGAAKRSPRKEPRVKKRRRRDVGGDALDEVDRVLDKIREHGMDSLTDEERAFLNEMSRRYKESPEQAMH